MGLFPEPTSHKVDAGVRLNDRTRLRCPAAQQQRLDTDSTAMKNARWQPDLLQLRQVRLFQNVAASSLEQLLREFRACELEAGEVLLSPFNRNQYLYLLLEGELKVFLGSLDNQAVSTLHSGDCAGEISFIDNDHPSAYVVATTTSLVLRLHPPVRVELMLIIFQFVGMVLSEQLKRAHTVFKQNQMMECAYISMEIWLQYCAICYPTRA